MANIITLSNVSKTFSEGKNKIHVLDNINLSVAEGEIFVFLGPSGSGKSTILRLMSGLDREYHGVITFNKEAQEKAAFIFQQFAILPWLTVYQNVELWLTGRGVPEKERRARVEKELSLLKLNNASNLFPRQLSGGMKQRVGIARALAIEPAIIFMDEPFSEVDSFTADTLRKDLLDIWQERKMTIVMVTHILDETLELADHIAVLSERPAHIKKIIENKLPRPREKRSSNFFALEDELYRLIKIG